MRISSFNGIDVFRIITEKFKTSSIHFFFQDNLTRESVTKNALLPAVMRRGSEAYKTLRDISIRLEDLYGASFDCGVTKKGERHIIHFYIEFLSHQYIPGGIDLFADAFDLLFGIITKPLFENGVFRDDYLDQEKDNLKMLINSRVNDKMQYSVDRCLEETCKDEPYAIYNYGFLEDVDAIGAQDLTNHHRTMIESFPLQVYLAGSITDRHEKLVTERLSGLTRKNLVVFQNGFLKKQGMEPRHVTEEMNVTQGKLCLGFRTNTEPKGSDYTALMVFNGILGGGIQSKLFQNVREKASLAYYSYSRLDKFKGLMVVSSGIDAANKEKALEIILRQIDDIKNGIITDSELEATVKNMETGIRSLGDSQINMVDFYLSQTITQTQDDFNDIIDKIKKVTKDEIVRIAHRVVLDTVYFLTAPSDTGEESIK